MEFNPTLTDETLLTELGERLARRRIELDLTQAELAEEAGVAKRTLERLEAGHSVQLVTLLRLLRVLGLVEGLEQVLPAGGPSPMDLLKAKTAARPRQRARRSTAEEPPSEPWTWGDES